MRSRFEQGPVVPPGQATRVVRVVQVGVMVDVVDQFGSFIEVPLRYHRAGRLPQIGESWVIDRSVGFWTLLFPLDGVVTPASKFATTITPTAGVVSTINHRLGRDVQVQAFDNDTGEDFDPLVVLLDPDNPPARNEELSTHDHGPGGDGTHTHLEPGVHIHHLPVPESYAGTGGQTLRSKLLRNPNVRRFERTDPYGEDWVELTFQEQPPNPVRVVLIG